MLLILDYIERYRGEIAVKVKLQNLGAEGVAEAPMRMWKIVPDAAAGRAGARRRSRRRWSAGVRI
jgi:hypothetical protein